MAVVRALLDNGVVGCAKEVVRAEVCGRGNETGRRRGTNDALVADERFHHFDATFEANFAVQVQCQMAARPRQV